MTKKRILLAILTLAAIFAAAFLLRMGMETPLVVEADSGTQGTTATFFKKTPGDLAAADSKVDCGKPKKAIDSVGEDLNHFWQNTEDDEVETFLHFDPRSRVLTVCHKGQPTAALLPVDANTADIEMVRVSEAQFGDMNGDGKNEFFVFQGQCAEGPCLGSYFLFQIDGGKIKKLYTLHAETVDQAKESGRNGLRMEKYCFTYEFGMGPAYFSVAEFGKDGELTTVPYQELRVRFPLAVAEMKPSQDLGFDEDSPPQQKAYLKMHDLIVQAYQGKPLADLMKEHDKVLSEMLPVEGETSPSMRLNLYCDMKEILELISGK